MRPLLLALRAAIASIFTPRYVLGDNGRPKRVFAWSRVADWGCLARALIAPRLPRTKHRVKMTARWFLERGNGELVSLGKQDLKPLGPNLILDQGLDAMLDRLFNSATTQGIFAKMEIGTGATAETSGDTGLQTAARRASATFAAGGTGVCTLSCTFAADGVARTYTEAGLGVSAVLGTADLWNRKTFTGVPIGTTENVTAHVVITAGNG